MERHIETEGKRGRETDVVCEERDDLILPDNVESARLLSKQNKKVVYTM